MGRRESNQIEPSAYLVAFFRDREHYRYLAIPDMMDKILIRFLVQRRSSYLRKKWSTMTHCGYVGKEIFHGVESE